MHLIEIVEECQKHDSVCNGIYVVLLSRLNSGHAYYLNRLATHSHFAKEVIDSFVP